MKYKIKIGPLLKMKESIWIAENIDEDKIIYDIKNGMLTLEFESQEKCLEFKLRFL